MPTLIFCALLALTCTSFKGAVPKVFWAEIWQDGQRLPMKNEVVELARRPFQIKVIIRDEPSLYLNGSFQKNYFSLRSQEDVPDLEWLPYKSYAEVPHNAEKLLNLSEEEVHHLCWDESDGNLHKFDDPIQVRNGLMICTKSVEKLQQRSKADHEWDVVDLATIDQDVYLFVVATTPFLGHGKPAPKELARQNIHLKWK